MNNYYDKKNVKKILLKLLLEYSTKDSNFNQYSFQELINLSQRAVPNINFVEFLKTLINDDKKDFSTFVFFIEYFNIHFYDYTIEKLLYSLIKYNEKELINIVLNSRYQIDYSWNYYDLIKLSIDKKNINFSLITNHIDLESLKSEDGELYYKIKNIINIQKF